MSSAAIPIQSRLKFGKQGEGRSYLAGGMIFLGVVLLILALAMAVFVFIYYPRMEVFSDNKRIQRTPKAIPVENSQSPPSASPTPTNEPKKKASKHPANLRQHAPISFRTGARNHSVDSQAEVETRSAHRFVASQSQFASEPVASPTPSEPVVVRCITTQEKPSMLRRFINWLAGLFRKNKAPPKSSNQPPTVTLAADERSIKLGCDNPNIAACNPQSDHLVSLTTKASDPDGDRLLYTYTSTSGRITGQGANSSWDLSGVQPGTYTATVEVDDGCGCVSFSSTTVTIEKCTNCVPPCPDLSVSCPTDQIEVGQPARVSANVSGGDPNASITYKWTRSGGTISSGQGSPSITIDTTGLAGGDQVTATVELGDVVPECHRTDSCTFGIRSSPRRLGAISGIVTNKNAIIAGATVTATSLGIQWTTTTGEDGSFRITGLPLGQTYDVKITAPGFEKKEWPGITLSVNHETSRAWELTAPEAMPSPTVGPSPEPTASPGASPSPSTSPNPSKSLVEQDKMTARYPNRFLKDTSAEVTFDLKKMWEEERSIQTTTTNGNVEVVDVAPDLAGAQPRTFRPLNSKDYDTYLVVRLIPRGLTIVSESDNSKRFYSGELVQWAWQLTPSGDSGHEASFDFEVDVLWKSKKTSEITIQTIRWPQEPRKVLIGPPVLSIKAATYGSPFVLFAGIAAIGYGGKRRKSLLNAVSKDKPSTAGGRSADRVTSSVYAPTEAVIGSDFLVQVFAHLADQAEGLEAIAIAAQPGDIWRGAARLMEDIERGTELTFELSMKGLVINDSVQKCIWNGELEQLQFIVTVPDNSQPGNVVGILKVERNTFPLGRVSFVIKLTNTMPVESVSLATRPVVVGTMRRFGPAFISYTRKDRREVLKRVQMLESIGIEYFQDLLTLNPGDEFEKIIYDYIDRSDVFYLFWSQAASESEWVKKEILRAVQRRESEKEGLPEIKPIILEIPPAQPPAELSTIHFDDKIMRVMNSGNALTYFWWLIRNRLLPTVIEDIFRRPD